MVATQGSHISFSTLRPLNASIQDNGEILGPITFISGPIYVAL